MSTQVSGMALAIRSATESDTFDLAGHSPSNIETTVTSAFTDPFNLSEMIRITFVVGAGKLGRSKYDDKASLHVTSALRQLGYVEDRGASCVNECGGSFKTQHDTGKNLFTVVVFPKLVQEGDNGGESNNTGGGNSMEYPIPIPLFEGSALHTVLLSSEATFEKMVPSMAPSWSEKKFCSELLKDSLDTVEQMDGKLMTGTPLSDDEQAFYDDVGGALVIGSKLDRIKKQMQQQVEAGALTADERNNLIHQVSERLEGLNDEIESALQKSQEKKVAKLNMQREKAEARRKMLVGHSPQPTHKLKHEDQIMTLKKRLQPLLKLEASAKGRLLTVKETKTLAEKDELLEEIEELELASQGWFEEEDVFMVRLEASRKKKVPGAGGNKSSGGGGKKPGTTSRAANAGKTNWFTPGGLAAKQAALGKKTAASKVETQGGGGVFAAMMMDSDSDSD
eukprot:g9254.t1 g9254   contig36:211716-213068(-)